VTENDPNASDIPARRPKTNECVAILGGEWEPNAKMCG
jgi:hypothetical protein